MTSLNKAAAEGVLAPLQVDGARLWATLEQMGAIGGTAKGGVSRLALTDLDRQARDLLVQWARDAGCSVRVDKMGNIFMRRPGEDDTLAPLQIGSHGDSQPSGGRYDGIYGVLGGLEVIRRLNDLGLRTRRPVEVVNWTNEEGSRFAPAMIASGVYAGVFDLEYGLSRADAQGVTIAEALRAIGYDGDTEVAGHTVHAHLELHIEQGPILEAEGYTIGVVTGGQGQRWYEASFAGRSAHAGTTPMNRRKDALLGAARIVEGVNEIGLRFAPDACATVGMLNVHPNSRNVVPGQVRYTIEFRHPDDAVLDAMDLELKALVERVAAGLALESELKCVFSYAPLAFDARCIATIQQAAEQAGYAQRLILSGAGHDACYINRIAPTGMIFIPCVDGISHNEAEAISAEWAEAGANVLLNAAVALAAE